MPLKNNIGSFVVAFEARQTATRNVRPSTVSMLKFGARDLVIDVPFALNFGHSIRFNRTVRWCKPISCLVLGST
jgi:hypothetical protein